MIVALRGLLALILLAGAYLLVTVLVLFYLGLVGLCVWAISDGTFNVTFVWLLIGGGFVITALVRAMVQASGANTELPDGLLLSRERAPELWKLVDELAGQAGTRAPAELWLTAEANAAVSEESRGLGLLAGPRRLEVGVPLLVGLPTDELRAVLCHELGHYARGHTRLGPVIYRGSVALAGARRNIARAALSNSFARMYGGLPLYLLSAYAWLYNGISLAVRRRQELDADAIAVRIAGRAATADALRSAESLSVAWADFQTRFEAPMRMQGRVPDDPFSAFQTMISDPDYRDVLAAHRQRAPEPRRATARDSHPSLEQRLAKIDRLPDTAVLRDPSSPLELLPDPEQHFRRLQRMTLPRRVDPMPWRDWLSSVTELHAGTQLEALRTAVHRVRRTTQDSATDTFSLGVVLDMLEAGHGARLAMALANEQSLSPLAAVPARTLLCEAVFTLVGQALVRAGSANWTVPWTGTRRLITRDTTPEELQDLVRAAVDKPTEVSRLRLDLAASTVDVDRPLPLPDDSEDKVDPAIFFDEDTELLEEQRSSLKVILAVGIPAVVIAALISLSSNNDRPRYTPPPYQPLPLTTRPLYYPTDVYPRIPTLPALPTFRPPPLTLPLPLPTAK